MTEILKYIVRPQERKTFIWMTLVEFHCLTHFLALGVLCMSVVPVACEYYVHKTVLKAMFDHGCGRRVLFLICTVHQ